MAPRTPLRRCVGCGSTRPKDRLLRFAVAPGPCSPGAQVVMDLAGTMPGRGAYLCRDAAANAPAQDCLRVALRRGGIARTLRSRAPIAPELVESIDGGQETSP
ncbi:MAG: YlxR family protein [Solirubrobacteraceae bacterium]